MRVINEKLCKSYQCKPCIICGQTETTVGHHVKSNGAGGHDIEQNLMALCYNHHMEIHQHGLNTFTENHFNAFQWMNDSGWEFNEFAEWFRPQSIGEQDCD